MRRTIDPALWAVASLIYPSIVSAQSSLPSKRGLAYLGDTHESDESLLLSAKSAIDWYYNWSPTPVPNLAIPFVPLIHGLADADASTTQAALSSLPATSTHLLTFNEPDGTTGSGGSAIAPEDAARVYIESIVPLRTRWNISHPVTTGSSSGLSWLREFNASCWDIAPEDGCPTDFVAVHWYGNFAGLASWLGTLREFYVTGDNASTSGAVGGDELHFWITEMALPQESADDTIAMLNQSMTYLDGLDYVAAYAWYGADRKGGDWDDYTGDNVAMFGSGGKLTDVGALYLGGQEAGFEEGMTGAASGARMHVSALLVIVSAMGVLLNTW